MSLRLYSVGFTNNLLDIDTKTLSLIITSIISFALIYFLVFGFMGTFGRKNNYKFLFSLNRLAHFKRILNYGFKIWLAFTALEIVMFGGVPLVAVVIQGNSTLDYTKFGIPSVHGFLNSLYFIVTTGYFLHYKLTKDKDSRKKVFILIFWPFLVMSRATLLWVTLQMFYIHLLFTKINVKRFFSISVGVVLFIISFGILGDSRSGEQEVRFTDSFISVEYKEIGQKMPTGFVWVYLYATTPINNLIHNADLKPTYDFSQSFKSLIPSAVRKLIFKGNSKNPLNLYQEGFNVSSYFANYLSDFGHFGANILVAILQLIVVVIYFLSKKMKIGSILAYAALFYAVFTSVFFDNFMSLVTVSQIFMGFTINKMLYKNKNNYAKE